MAFQFNGFRATKPRARLLDPVKVIYEVFFIAYDAAGKKHVFQNRSDINKHTASERKNAAQGAANAFWEGLNRGWNPLSIDYPAFSAEVIQAHTFSTALDFALAKKKKLLSEFSYYDYAGCARFMKTAAKECGLLDATLSQIRRRDIRMLVATAKEQRDWSSKSRNKYLTLLKALLSVMVDEDIIENNPASRIKNEKEEATLGFKRLSPAEKQVVYNHLVTASPDYFEYLMFIYHAGIRRKEVLYLKVKDVDITRSTLTIRPEVAKTNKERIVPLAADLMTILMHRELWRLPKEWYIFSSNRFLPGPEKFHPNTPTRWWQNIVQKGLEIDCKMYALKHTGADDKIRAGVPLEALKKLYGHRSSQMTEIYARAIQEQYDQQIVQGSKPFAKVVEMKRKEG